MFGTSWRGPGQGATIHELQCKLACARGLNSCRAVDAAQYLADLAHKNGCYYRTNLMLTNRPIIDYDLERMLAVS